MLEHVKIITFFLTVILLKMCHKAKRQQSTGILHDKVEQFQHDCGSVWGPQVFLPLEQNRWILARQNWGKRLILLSFMSRITPLESLKIKAEPGFSIPFSNLLQQSSWQADSPWEALWILLVEIKIYEYQTLQHLLSQMYPCTNNLSLSVPVPQGDGNP